MIVIVPRLFAQKQHEMENTVVAEARRTSYYCKWKFVAGIACMVVGAVMNILQLSFLSQTESYTLAALTLVWNLVLARGLLGERVSPMQALGNLIVAGGTVVAVLWKGDSGVSSQALGVQGVAAALSQPRAVAGAATVLLLLCVCVLCVYWLDGAPPDAGHRSPAMCVLRTVTAGLCQACTGVAVKSLISIVQGTPQGASALYFVNPWVVGVACIIPCGVLGQIVWLNSALRRYDTKLVVPVFQGMLLLTGVTLGQFILGEVSQETASSAMGLWMGVAACVAGVTVIFRGGQEASSSPRLTSPDSQEHELVPLTTDSMNESNTP